MKNRSSRCACPWSVAGYAVLAGALAALAHAGCERQPAPKTDPRAQLEAQRDALMDKMDDLAEKPAPAADTPPESAKPTTAPGSTPAAPTVPSAPAEAKPGRQSPAAPPTETKPPAPGKP
jgi:hypothetical protein